MREMPIGIFDSGVGGLSVLRQCVAELPDERYIYLADSANMPYGNRPAAEIRCSAAYCFSTLVAMGCKAVVVACNTATETAIVHLRELFPSVIAVGLEPAIKPCLKELAGGYAVALVTDATARSPRFVELAADSRVVVSPQRELAGLIDAHMGDIVALKPYVDAVLVPYPDAESIVLGCSHYSHISRLIAEHYGGRIKIYDGARGAAVRLKKLIVAAGLKGTGPGSVRFYRTYITRR